MRKVLFCLLLAIAPAGVAASETVRERVVQELRQDGFTDIRVYRTFLGRLRFVGENQNTRREIVVSPSTGVVLRDYQRALEISEDDDRDEDDNEDVGSNSGSGGSSGTESSGGGNSGSGSSSSGSGGSGSSGGGGSDDSDDDDDSEDDD